MTRPASFQERAYLGGFFFLLADFHWMNMQPISDEFKLVYAPYLDSSDKQPLGRQQEAIALDPPSINIPTGTRDNTHRKP